MKITTIYDHFILLIKIKNFFNIFFILTSKPPSDNTRANHHSKPDRLYITSSSLGSIGQKPTKITRSTIPNKLSALPELTNLQSVIDDCDPSFLNNGLSPILAKISSACKDSQLYRINAS